MTIKLPRILYALALVGLALLVLPIAALLIRADWADFPAALSAPETLEALGLSLRTSAAATALCLILGVPLALVLARSTSTLSSVLRVATTLPLVLPPLVGGMALLFLLGRTGLIGSLIAPWGIQIPFTTLAVIIAQTFVALPFLVLSIEGAARTAGQRYEAVAATLGAGRWRTWWRITVPLLGPGLLSGTVLSFARALGEFGATALFAGNAAGITRTMPLAIYTAFNGTANAQGSAVAMAIVLIAMAALVLVFLRPWKSGTSRDAS
ncbi:ABC transporter permease [Haematomicrobium sanguinis]|uniref:ABC transporter permease n=1 Tax=Haematomicrobium sanguinis TaxID=479106 RepID=UPI000AF961E7|nr:ABC transporter permease [Haematomicrobium sanguinis]